MSDIVSQRANEIAEKVEAFVRDIVIPYEKDARFEIHGHGPTEDNGRRDARQGARGGGADAAYSF